MRRSLGALGLVWLLGGIVWASPARQIVHQTGDQSLSSVTAKAPMDQADYGPLGKDRWEAIINLFDIGWKADLTPEQKLMMYEVASTIPLIPFVPLPKFTRPSQFIQATHPATIRTNGAVPLMAGSAWRSIAPPIGCPLAGFGGDRLLPSSDPYADPYDLATIYKSNTGVHDPIRSKAVVLDAGGQLFIQVGVDAIGTNEPLYLKVLQKIQARGLNITEENLIISATHTHGGPGAVTTVPLWQLITVDLYKPEVEEFLTDRIADSVLDAYNSRVPAALGVSTGWYDGATHNRRDDIGKYDKELLVIRVDRLDGTPLGVLFNYPVHGTSLGSDNFYYTADCMGYAERYIQETLGNDCVAVHINGAEGDVAPNRGGFDGARWVGETIGGWVMQLRGSTTTANAISLKIASKIAYFPTPQLRPGIYDDLMGIFPMDFTIPLGGLIENWARFTAVNINDDTVLATVPGEAITEIGWDIKDAARQLGFTNVGIWGLSCAHLSYFCTESEYWQGGYEAGADFFGPQSGILVKGNAVDVIDNVLP